MRFFTPEMVDHTFLYELRGVQCRLLPEKAIHLPEPGVLLLSDLHLGKVNHFRRSGIPVPSRANDANTENLIQLLMRYSPARMVIIGDLFHSHYNSEWEVFGEVVRAFPECRFELVTGNHDILGDHLYARHGITLCSEMELLPGLWLRHDPLTDVEEGSYQICGHLHPAIGLYGKGRQSMRLPCFWFGKTTAVLPAFGAFTGAKTISPRSGDRIFAIAEGKVIPL